MLAASTNFFQFPDPFLMPPFLILHHSPILTTHQVPIIIHNESEQATTWTRVFSEKTSKQSIPVITAWQLNERIYGELQGLNKQETAERYGKEKVYEWRRSYGIPPPKGIKAFWIAMSRMLILRAMRFRLNSN